MYSCEAIFICDANAKAPTGWTTLERLYVRSICRKKCGTWTFKVLSSSYKNPNQRNRTTNWALYNSSHQEERTQIVYSKINIRWTKAPIKRTNENWELRSENLLFLKAWNPTRPQVLGSKFEWQKEQLLKKTNLELDKTLNLMPYFFF